jgi:short subunit dehydrogenase-like uncharacterized protein
VTPWLIYGTGSVAAELAMQARRRGMPFLLAGRDGASLDMLADRYGVARMQLDLRQRASSLTQHLDGVSGVLNAAGP